MSARDNFNERCLAAGLGVEEWRLATALELHILARWDKDAGAYMTEERLGEALLRATSRLDGWSFQRARAGLVSKGVLHFESGGGGRGHRSLYAPNVAPTETPAQERGITEEEPTPAPEPGVGSETPAQTPAHTPAETPALERGRLEVSRKKAGNDDDGVVDHERDDEAIDELLALLGSFTRAQLGRVRTAWSERAEGVRALVGDVLAARGVDRPVGLFMSRLDDGEHLTIEVRPAPVFAPLPEPEPCPECNFGMGGHRFGCSLAPAADHARSNGKCPGCGYGGENGHLEDCAVLQEGTG